LWSDSWTDIFGERDFWALVNIVYIAASFEAQEVEFGKNTSFWRIWKSEYNLQIHETNMLLCNSFLKQNSAICLRRISLYSSILSINRNWNCLLSDLLPNSFPRVVFLCPPKCHKNWI
jgi:hypothetical protein